MHKDGNLALSKGEQVMPININFKRHLSEETVGVNR